VCSQVLLTWFVQWGDFQPSLQACYGGAWMLHAALQFCVDYCNLHFEIYLRLWWVKWWWFKIWWVNTRKMDVCAKFLLSWFVQLGSLDNLAYLQACLWESLDVASWILNLCRDAIFVLETTSVSGEWNGLLFVQICYSPGYRSCQIHPPENSVARAITSGKTHYSRWQSPQ
jgi:hypothetical protein